MIDKILRKLRPGSEWSCNGDTYEGITWYSTDQSMPSKLEFESAIPLVKAELQALKYIDLRKKEYPELVDQLEAIWKGGAEQAEMKAKIEAIKIKYPKPLETNK